MRFAWRNLLKFTLWALVVTGAYVALKAYTINISIPFAPLSTIGIAVAFYVGFKIASRTTASGKGEKSGAAW